MECNLFFAIKPYILLSSTYWYLALTCTSDSFNACAMCERSVRLRYFFAWNSRSSSNSCSEVNAVRRRRALLPPVFDADKFCPFSKDLLGLVVTLPMLPLTPSEMSWPSLDPTAPPPSSSLSADTRPFSDPATREWLRDTCQIASFLYIKILI